MAARNNTNNVNAFELPIVDDIATKVTGTRGVKADPAFLAIMDKASEVGTLSLKGNAGVSGKAATPFLDVQVNGKAVRLSYQKVYGWANANGYKLARSGNGFVVDATKGIATIRLVGA